MAPPSSWKRLTAGEAQIITDAGLWIVSFFERGATNAKGGAAQGRIDGLLALQYAKEVGQPESTTIYATVDYDAPASDLNTIEAYMRVFDAEIDGYELGVYGSYTVCKGMYERGVTRKLAQTYAWSRGLKYEHICFYQYQNDTVENGVNVDLDETNGDSGGWMVGMAIKQQQQQPKPGLDSGAGLTILRTWMDPAYDKAEAECNQEDKDRIRWLGQQLRLAFDIPPDAD